MRLVWPSSCALVFVLGCGPAVDAGEGNGESAESSSSSDGPGTSATTSAGTQTTIGTTDPVTTGTSTSTTDPTTPTVTMTTDPSTSVTVSSTTDPTDPTGGELPNGESCDASDQCASGHCFVVGVLGGICSECEVDADCGGGGCTPPNPLANPPVPAVCNDGGYGEGCMSSEVCQDGLQCATVLDVPGIISAASCSECAVDADCDPGMLCAPDISVLALTGVYRCVTAGTLANGQSCEYAGTGDASCVSGHCAIADVMGILQLGVCSECEIDDHCGPDQLCQAPQVDLMAGLLPGFCG